MRVRRLTLENYRGVARGELNFPGNTLLVGGNNSGKSTVCEALDLVLGPERLARRPIVDEHDFHGGRYMNDAGEPIAIRIEALLLDLSPEAERRFKGNLRRWDEGKGVFVDEAGEGPGAADRSGTCWALPVVFLGRYNAADDDFEGNTFFAHPQREVDPSDEEVARRLGPGLTIFSRDHKRMCGFVFLRALRTGTRALSLHRGSLLDTILRLGSGGLSEMWRQTLERLRTLDPAIGDIEQLKVVRTEIRQRMSRFVGLAKGESATAFFASDLTREHLRDVVRFFVASEQSGFQLPFQRLGTGTVNVLVFALLTFIAELKQKRSVIFAMEEPEIALPPHTQRRVAQFVLAEMGQAIVTSHSPYIIEEFEPEAIVMLNRPSDGVLQGVSIDTRSIKPKTFKVQRRQFAEAILSRAVLVVEGGTETVVFPAVSSALEALLGRGKYDHIDLAGVTVFDAGGDGNVAMYGPIFKALGKPVFAFHDKRNQPPSPEEEARLRDYDEVWSSSYGSIEDLLAKEVAASTLRKFLDAAKDRRDYPQMKKYAASSSDEEVRALAREVLLARKGEAHAYGEILITHCETLGDLPTTLKDVLEKIHGVLTDATEHEEKSSGGDSMPTGPVVPDGKED
jgi:putative ATP-dependent endonuclease of the OLD family